MSDYMDKPDTNRESTEYYGGGIYSSFRSHEGCLNFFSLMKEIEFVLNLQGDTMTVLFSLFENPITVHEDNQGVIKLAVAMQMQPGTKHIAIKYHHFWKFSLMVT